MIEAMIAEKRAVSLGSLIIPACIALSLLPAFLLSFPVWADFQSHYFHQPFLMLLTIFLAAKNKRKLIRYVGLSKTGFLVTDLLFLIVGVYCYWITVVSGFFTLLSLTVPLYVGVVIWFVCGKIALRKSCFYLLLLGLSFPFPTLAVSIVKWFLQKGTVLVTAFIMGLFDAGTVCNDPVIVSFGYSLQVGYPCCGINSLIILVPLLLLACKMLEIKGKLVFWFAAMLPVSVICFNALRVISLFCASLFMEFESAVKHFHTIGPLFFGLNAVLVLLVLRWSKRWPGVR